jgi:predicted alpha/beta superfamily hydrolase
MWLRSAVLTITMMLPFSVGATQQAPCHATVTGGLQIERFQSKVFPYPQTLRVWLPPGYRDAANAQGKYPVLYMFDGQNIFAGCRAGVPSGWRVDETLTRLIGEHKAEPIIVVGIDAPDDGAKRASELLAIPDTIGQYKFVPHGDRLPTFMSQEVMPRIERHYRVQTGRASTAVGGASYGGVAAIYLLTTMADSIGLGLIESPSGSPGNGEIARWTEHLYVAPLRVSIGVGDIESHDFHDGLAKLGLDPDETDRAFARISRAVADNLREAGGERAQVRFVEDPEGKHSEAAWARRFPEAVKFLFPAK